MARRQPTLQTIPMDLKLHISTFLVSLSDCLYQIDITPVTLAAILQDKYMLNHLIETEYDEEEITPDVALAGNLEFLKWVIERKKCPVYEETIMYVVTVGNLDIVKYLHQQQSCPWDEDAKISSTTWMPLGRTSMC